MNQWMDTVTVSQNPDFSVSLTAIKHDHPLLASGYDSVTKNPTMYNNDGMLIGSLPPTSTVINPNWQFNDMEKVDQTPYCMPYGICYDESFLDQTQPKKSECVDLIYPLEDEWALNNKLFNCESDYGQQMWSPLDYFEKPIKLEEAFQVDKIDKTGPTLAQLNSDVWDAIDLDELLLSSSDVKNQKRIESLSMNNYQKNIVASVPPQQSMLVEEESKLQDHIDYLSSMLSSSSKENTNAMVLIKKEVVDSSPCESLQTQPFPVAINPPAQPNTVLSTLLNSPSVEKPNVTSSAPTKQPELQQVPMQTVSAVVEKSSPATRNRNSSMSTECSASSHDEGFDSESDDSDDESFYGDYDAKDLLGASTSDDANNKWALNMGRSRKGGQQRYFWQYNVQSKGPKGTRISSVEDSNGDPHVLMEASDPVFSPDCHVEGVKHAGKARRGDGNDLTPNPRKLLMIGLELKKLSNVINDLTPVAEVPVTARNKSRKEKNKLASRACRLKKKAQHEANKIKLFGLQQEHKKLMTVLIDIRKYLRRPGEQNLEESSFSTKFEQIIAQKGPSVTVAGKTTEFVNSILDNVASGVNNGGLENV
ncbi:hypothetical protein B4U80_04753 [Leptotrombidium deliense]|uniref:BZIP domain-containing protein n=1 Tax=Leptotrombidium deliense TaxID=299467 RepID=A0A443SPJ8_9ACAR|nr:hypothetical protein B4U80_04753 [Leptotrombidium deliense]